METHYQRGKIQDESLHYESLKHSGELPVIGVNTFENPEPEDGQGPVALMRASSGEKEDQIAGLESFHRQHEGERQAALDRLQAVARRGENLFEELMQTVQVASLGQISDALFEVGGRYRRSM
jgi:methylmalonyl-CoA mutase